MEDKDLRSKTQQKVMGHNNKNQAVRGEHIKYSPSLNLQKTIARELFEHCERPWEIFSGLSNFIYKLGPELPFDKYDEISDGVWVHTSAYMMPSVKIDAPAIIQSGAKICHGAHISGSIIGACAVVGDHSSVRDSVIFDIGKLYASNTLVRSVLGYNSSLGAGAVAADIKLDRSTVSVLTPEGMFFPGTNNLGAIIGDCTRIGANSVLNPGCIIDDHTLVHPLCSVSGYIPPYSIVKSGLS